MKTKNLLLFLLLLTFMPIIAQNPSEKEQLLKEISERKARATAIIAASIANGNINFDAVNKYIDFRLKTGDNPLDISRDLLNMAKKAKSPMAAYRIQQLVNQWVLPSPFPKSGINTRQDYNSGISSDDIKRAIRKNILEQRIKEGDKQILEKIGQLTEMQNRFNQQNANGTTSSPPPSNGQNNNPGSKTGELTPDELEEQRKKMDQLKDELEELRKERDRLKKELKELENNK
jgi:hypothetical protein